jgi:hypothetical protein
MFKKNQKVAKIIVGGGVKTATIQTIASVGRGGVRLVDSGITYDSESGLEIDPPIPGFYSEIVALEDQ